MLGIGGDIRTSKTLMPILKDTSIVGDKRHQLIRHIQSFPDSSFWFTAPCVGFFTCLFFVLRHSTHQRGLSSSLTVMQIPAKWKQCALGTQRALAWHGNHPEWMREHTESYGSTKSEQTTSEDNIQTLVQSGTAEGFEGKAIRNNLCYRKLARLRL